MDIHIVFTRKQRKLAGKIRIVTTPGKWSPAMGVMNESGKKSAPGHCDKQSCIVSEGTPDLSGRAFNHAGPLPHECGVPSQCPGALWLKSAPTFRSRQTRRKLNLSNP
jgi:hypothetical protein